jgi:hypothetical protein
VKVKKKQHSLHQKGARNDTDRIYAAISTAFQGECIELLSV